MALNNRRFHNERGVTRDVPQRLMQPEITDRIANVSAVFSATTLKPSDLNFRSWGVNVSGTSGTNTFTTTSTTDLVVGCVIRITSGSGDQYTILSITNSTTFTVTTNLTTNYTTQALFVGGVSNWYNSSICRGYTFSQGTASQQPLLILDAINGDPALWFKGVSVLGGGNINNNLMVMSDNNSDGFNGSYPILTGNNYAITRHLHIVVKFNKHAPAAGNGAMWSVIGGVGNSVAGTLSLAQTGRSGQSNSIKMCNCRGSGITCEVGGAPVVSTSTGTWYVISCEFARPDVTAANNNLILNGTLSTAAPQNDLIDISLIGTAIGYDWYYGSFEGWIAEVVLYNGPGLATTQLWKVHNKLRKKYGI